MVASGVPVANSNHASDLANMALDIIGHVTSFQVTSFGGCRLQVRIGLNSGPVVGAVVGRRAMVVMMMMMMMMTMSEKKKRKKNRKKQDGKTREEGRETVK